MNLLGKFIVYTRIYGIVYTRIYGIVKFGLK